MKNVNHFFIPQEDIDKFTNDSFWYDTKETFEIEKNLHTVVCKKYFTFISK